MSVPSAPSASQVLRQAGSSGATMKAWPLRAAAAGWQAGRPNKALHLMSPTMMAAPPGRGACPGRGHRHLCPSGPQMAPVVCMAPGRPHQETSGGQPRDRQTRHRLSHQKHIRLIGGLGIASASLLACAPRVLAKAQGDGNGGNGAAGGGGGGSGGGGGDSAGKASPPEASTNQGAGAGEDVILLDISGMKCGGCVGRVKRLLEEVPEVASASVNLATETALVRVVITPIGEKTAQDVLAELRQTLCDILNKSGFKSSVRESGANGNSAAGKVVAAKRAEREERLRDASRRLIVAGALASTCLLHHLCHFFPGAPAWLKLLGSMPVQAGISTAALLGPGRQILVDGFRGLMNGAPDMNSLVGMGAVASFGMSCVAAALPRLGWPTFFEEPAMLLGIVLLGKTLEERAKLAASSDMSSLQCLLPATARLMLEGGASREVPSDVLQPGDVVSLQPGDRAPVDGVVISGTSTVDESALTGEPLPVSKSQGAEVMAGTVNVDGALLVRANACSDKTAIADVVRLVEEAQSRTAPVQRLADRVSGMFAYGVMGASLATFAFWATIGTQMFPQVLSAKNAAGASAAAGATAAAAPALGAKLLLSLQLACNVLVVACPCALGLATPTAVLVGTSAAAKQGLLIRGGDVLENASKIDTVVFDKTGTLTAGRPVIVDISVNEPAFTEQQVLSAVASVERNTPHPIARALVAHADGEGLKVAPIREGSFLQEPGSGACAVVEGREVLVGNLGWLQARGVRVPASAVDAAAAQQHGTTVYAAIAGKFAGSVSLQDEVREGAAAVVESLKRQRVTPVMLSGDSEQAAQRVGQSLGLELENIYGGVKPAGKAEVVRELQAAGKRVAMVGDGINDTAALASANVGVAMGSGVDAASDVADIILLGDRVPQVLDALNISQATFNKIRQNLWWAFGYNLIGIPIAAGALLPAFGFALTPSLSGGVMAFSSLAVMGNSLLLQVEAEQQARKTASLTASPATGERARALSPGGTQGGSDSNLTAVKVVT